MPPFETNDLDDDETVDKRPGWLAVVISLLVLAALLASLILPVLEAERPRPRPTPTPRVLLEAKLRVHKNISSRT